MVMVFSMIPVVLGLSAPPLDLWGYVDGGNVADGTSVTAVVNGKSFSMAGGTKSGLYGIQIPRDNPSTPEKEGGNPGDRVTIVVNGKVASPSLSYPDGLIYRHDVHITGSSSSCAEDWGCGEWSDCEDGQQTRSCSDDNNCGTTQDKPRTKISCSWEKVVEDEKSEQKEEVQETLLLPGNTRVVLEPAISISQNVPRTPEYILGYYNPYQPSKFVGSIVSTVIILLGLSVYYVLLVIRKKVL